MTGRAVANATGASIKEAAVEKFRGGLRGQRGQVYRATTMYREMGMTYWLEQAEAEMRDLA